MTQLPAHEWTPYCGAAPHPADWLAAWNLDPVLLLAVSAGLVLGRTLSPERMRSHLACGVVVLILFASPLCTLGSALFSVRAAHHAIIALLLAPLLAQSLALDRSPVRLPLHLATALQALVLWFWHVPQAYGLALSSDGVFWIMQLSIAGTAALWWASVWRARWTAAVAATLATMVQMGGLGALLTFAGRAFYAPHYATTQAWGLSPLEDQQIAGLIMSAPASAAYLIMALVILYRAMSNWQHPVPA